MINIITFDEKTKRFAEYTDSEWGEEIEWWREQLWPKFEDSIFEFEKPRSSTSIPWRKTSCS